MRGQMTIPLTIAESAYLIREVGDLHLTYPGGQLIMCAENKRALAALEEYRAKSQPIGNVPWVPVSKAKPPPHARYYVRRHHRIHTATPCYGMHLPWWVPMGMDGQEGEPVNMENSDEWMPCLEK